MGIQRFITVFPLYLCVFNIFHNKKLKIDKINIKTNKLEFLYWLFLTNNLNTCLSLPYLKVLKTTSPQAHPSLNPFKAKYCHHPSADDNMVSTPLLPEFSQGRHTQVIKVPHGYRLSST